MGAWITVTHSRIRTFCGIILALIGISIFLGGAMYGYDFMISFVVGMIIIIIGVFIGKSGQHRYWDPNISSPPPE